MKLGVKGLALIFICGLLFCISGEVFAQSVVLTQTEIRENDDAVKILFSTNKSIPIECYDLSVPPQVVVDFMGEVYTNKPEVIMVNKGLVKQMRVVKGTKKSMDLDDSYYAIDFIIVDLERSARYDFDQGLTTAVLVVSKPGKKVSNVAAAKAVAKVKAESQTTIEPKPVAVAPAALTKEQEPAVKKGKPVVKDKRIVKKKAEKLAVKPQAKKEQEINKVTTEVKTKSKIKTAAHKKRSIKSRKKIKKVKTVSKATDKAAPQAQAADAQDKTILQKIASGPKALGRGIAHGVGSLGRGIKNIFTFGPADREQEDVQDKDGMNQAGKKQESTADNKSVKSRKRRTALSKKNVIDNKEKNKSKESIPGIKTRKRRKSVKTNKGKPRQITKTNKKPETSLKGNIYQENLQKTQEKVDENENLIKELELRLKDSEKELDAAIQNKEDAAKKLEDLENNKIQAKEAYEQSLKYREVSKNAANSVWTEYTSSKADLSNLLKQGASESAITEAENKYKEKKEKLELAIAAAEEAKNDCDAKNSVYLEKKDQYDQAMESLDAPDAAIEKAQIVHDDILKDLEQAKKEKELLAKQLSQDKIKYKQYKLEKDDARYLASLSDIDKNLIKRVEQQRQEEAQAKLEAKAQEKAKETARLEALGKIEEKEDREIKRKTRRESIKRRKTVAIEKPKTEIEEIHEDTLESAVELRNAGLEMQRNGDFDSAMKYYQQALLKDPKYAAVHNDLGILYEQKGLDEKAKMEYLNTLKLDPRYVRAHSNLALLYEKTGDNNKAYYHWKQRVILGNENDPWTKKAQERMELLEKKK